MNPGITAAGHAARLSTIFCLLLLALLAPVASAQPTTYDFVVAQDGSGDFTSVQAAFDAVPDNQRLVTAIYVKAGTYLEKVSLAASKWNVELDGEDAATTILTWDDYGGEPDTPYYTEGVSSTASAYINARDFTARNLTFANTHGKGAQATALVAAGNRGRFFDCRFLGYQDTLQTLGQKQFFKRCYIEGVTDFIFGGSTAVFAHCTIYATDSGFITLADTPATHEYGYLFRYCTITGAAPAESVFLGRSFGAARVVYYRCDLGPQIIPEGWLDCAGTGATDGAVVCAEYQNTGAGANTSRRVDWSIQLTDDEAAAYTLKKILLNSTVTIGVEDLIARLPWYSDSR